MSIYKTATFNKWQKKSSVGDNALLKAIQEIESGLVDANLGGGVFKKRVARQGFGKSGSYRTILASNYNGLWVFIIGFAKNERDNIENQELIAIQGYAKFLMGLAKSEIDNLLENKELYEVKNETK